MKFLCLPCDEVMSFAERQLPGDGTMAAVFTCPGCKREMALLTNPMETQIVSGLGVRVGGRTVPTQPLELTVSSMAEGRADAFEEIDADASGDATAGPVEALTPAGLNPLGGGRTHAGSDSPSAPGLASVSGVAGANAGANRAHAPARLAWSADAKARLDNVPSFVRGMVKRIYTDYARENGIADITPAVMDRARTDLGLEGM